MSPHTASCRKVADAGEARVQALQEELEGFVSRLHEVHPYVYVDV